jgi:hypothetical protein
VIQIRVWALHNTSKVRVSYLLLARKLDMEIPPDSLEAGGVIELSVAAAVDESVATAQTVCASFGTHRERSSIHFDHLSLREA